MRRVLRTGTACRHLDPGFLLQFFVQRYLSHAAGLRQGVAGQGLSCLCIISVHGEDLHRLDLVGDLRSRNGTVLLLLIVVQVGRRHDILAESIAGLGLQPDALIDVPEIVVLLRVFRRIEYRIAVISGRNNISSIDQSLLRYSAQQIFYAGDLRQASLRVDA